MASIPHRRPFGVVYLILNSVNGAVYVGQTTRRLAGRWNYHRYCLRRDVHQNPHLQHAWNKYGESAFECFEVEAHASREALDAAERLYIETLPALGVRLYNQKAGGGFGGEMSAETRAKIAAAHRGKPKSEQHKQRFSAARKGVPLNLDNAQREALRERGRRVFSRPDVVEKSRMAKTGKRRPPELVERSRATKLERMGKVYHMTGPDGTEYTTTDLVRFAEAHGLNYYSLRNVFYGLTKAYRGWTGWAERTK